MTTQTPIKGVYDINGDAIGLAEFTSTDTIPLTNGGTGATTSDGAVTNLLPSQSGNSGKYLTTNGTITSWATVSGGSSIPDYVSYTFASGL